MLLVFFLSLLFWLIRLRSESRYEAIENRRQVTGCEMARYLLDASGYSSAAVEVFSLAPANLSGKDIYLPQGVYQGKSLHSIVRAARAAVYFSRSRPLGFLGDFPESCSVWVYRFALAAWIPGMLSVFGNDLMLQAATWFWGSFFFMGFFAIPLEREMENQVMHLLKTSEFFEVDELVRLKKCLKSYRAGAFSLPFRAAAWALKKYKFAAASGEL